MEKIWIFQSIRDFKQEELNFINNKLGAFISQWRAHGFDLRAHYSIEENRFIIIKVDETIAKASGCSIDGLTHIIKDIDNQFNLKLLNRNYITYILPQNSLETISIQDFKNNIKSGIFSADTFFYNIAVSNSEELTHQFKVKIKESWAKNLLPPSC